MKTTLRRDAHLVEIGVSRELLQRRDRAFPPEARYLWRPNSL